MLEWSKPIPQSNTETPHNSLREQSADILAPTIVSAPTESLTKITYPDKIPSPQHMKDLLFDGIGKFALHDFELKECSYHPQTWAEMYKNYVEYTRLRQNFLRLISQTKAEECRSIGFDDEDMELLQNKQSPENYNTHLKIPFDFGGELNLENICLIKTHPIHDQIHQMIEMQIGCGFLKQHKIIYIPWFAGSFYHE